MGRRPLAAIVIALGVVACSGSQEELPGAAGSDTGESTAADRPFSQFRFTHDGRQWDLAHGEYLVAMLSTSCDHCEEEIAHLNELAAIPEFPPVVALMLGDEDTLSALRERTELSFPAVLVEPLTFFQFVGDAPPRVIYVRDGRQIHYWDEKAPEVNDLFDVVSVQR